MDSAKFIKETNDIFGFELEEPSPSSIRELTDNLRGRKSTTSSTKKNIADTLNERKHILENKKMVDVTGESKYDADDADFQMAIKLSLSETVDKNVYMDENEKLKRELEELKREREELKREREEKNSNPKTFDELLLRKERERFDILRKEREKYEKLEQQMQRDKEEEKQKMLEILRKEREEQEELEEIYKPCRVSAEHHKNQILALHQTTQKPTNIVQLFNKDVYKIHTEQKQIILHSSVFSNNHPYDVIRGYFITNTGVYHWMLEGIEYDAPCRSIINYSIDKYIRSPVYIFTEPLSVKYAKLIHYSLYPRNMGDMFNNECSSYRHYRRLESVIRLIPGHYKNGNWRQLDGFFGMYYNDVTNELSDVPPAFEE